jgi:hypothetical protein
MNRIARKLALAIKQPERTDGRMTAHFHFVLWNKEAETEIVVFIVRPQHKAGLVAVATRDLLHVGGTHAICIQRNRTWVPAASIHGEYANQLD